MQWSPCERIKPRSIFGERIPRQRKLSDAELFAFWRGQMGLAMQFIFTPMILRLMDLKRRA